MENIQDLLKKIRKKLNLSQEKLGIELGISQSAIMFYESGERFPRKQFLKIILEYADKHDIKYDLGNIFKS